MQPDLVITTQADFDLYEHLNAASYLLYRRKRSYMITIIATVILGIYLAITAYMDHDPLFLYVITPLWVVIFLAVSFFIMRTSTVAKRAAKRSVKFSNNAFAIIRYQFFPDHISVSSETAGVETGYDNVQQLAETSKFYLIFTNNVNAHCIKKADLGPSNVDLFRTYLQDKTGLTFQQMKY